MNASLNDFKATHSHLTTKASVKMDPRLREMFEAVTTFKRSEQDFDCDREFYLNQGLETFLFVDGQLVHSPKISGLHLKTSENFSDLSDGKNRSTILTHLHHSLMNDVYEMNLEKNVVLTKPVRLLRISTSGQISFPTLIVRAQMFSQLTLIEETITLDHNNVNLAETHLFVADGAKVDHIQIESGAGNSKSAGSTFAHTAKDASYRNFSFHLKGELNQRSLDLHIEAPGAHGESHVLYLLNGSEKSHVSTVIHHYTPDSTSAQLAKGILSDDSKGSFTGRIHILKDAQRVRSSQLNKNLLLSKKAQVFSEPQLEIFADDVKCSHGSTTGQLSADEIFYFEARGISHQRARNLLALGFGMEVVLKVEDATARAYLAELIGHELKNKFNLGGTL